VKAQATFALSFALAASLSRLTFSPPHALASLSLTLSPPSSLAALLSRLTLASHHLAAFLSRRLTRSPHSLAALFSCPTLSPHCFATSLSSRCLPLSPLSLPRRLPRSPHSLAASLSRRLPLSPLLLSRLFLSPLSLSRRLPPPADVVAAAAEGVLLAAGDSGGLPAGLQPPHAGSLVFVGAGAAAAAGTGADGSWAATARENQFVVYAPGGVRFITGEVRRRRRRHRHRPRRQGRTAAKDCRRAPAQNILECSPGMLAASLSLQRRLSLPPLRCYFMKMPHVLPRAYSVPGIYRTGPLVPCFPGSRRAVGLTRVSPHFL
jgi:hypothetical protein